MSFGNFLFGSSPKNRQVDLFSGGQQDLLTDLINKIIGGQGGFGFDEDFFQQSFVDPALKQFEQRTAPAIQQKFIGQGAGRSSSLQDALTRAGADVQGGLDQQRAQLLNEALNRQLQGAQVGLGARPFSIEQDPGSRGLLPEIAGGIGAGFGGAFGGAAGRGLGQAASSFFNRGFRR